MATFSPRCVQQLHRPQSHDPIPMKTTSNHHQSQSPSPYSPLTTPSSYDSEVDAKTTLIPNISNEQTSQLVSPSLSPSSTIFSCDEPLLSNQQDHHWVAKLLSTKFYGPCPNHINLRKNDQNLFCITHSEKICQYCHAASHSAKSNESFRSCSILHVSRYMYHDVLLAREASALLDVGQVQSYLNNGNRVIYIDRRAQPKSKLAPNAKSCAVCSRTLQDPYRFCSLFCRLQHANDPAADETVPVPDASPLVNQTVKKVKKIQDKDHIIPIIGRKIEKSTKRMNDKNITNTNKNKNSSPNSIVMTSTHVLSSNDVNGSTRKHRRKGKPMRSPLASIL